jgi:hypothetical protein
MLIKTIQLDWLLHYELQAAERYRRYVSMIMATGGANRARLRQTFTRVLRECDAIIQWNGSISVIMTDTQLSGALSVVERLKQECGESSKLVYSVVAYPQDGVVSAMLLTKAQTRLEQANTRQPGSVVSAD